jgi:hypothetical protein
MRNGWKETYQPFFIALPPKDKGGFFPLPFGSTR